MTVIAKTAQRLKVKIKATKEVVWGVSQGFGIMTTDGQRFTRHQYVVLDRKGLQE